MMYFSIHHQHDDLHFGLINLIKKNNANCRDFFFFVNKTDMRYQMFVFALPCGNFVFILSLFLARSGLHLRNTRECASFQAQGKGETGIPVSFQRKGNLPYNTKRSIADGSVRLDVLGHGGRWLIVWCGRCQNGTLRCTRCASLHQH
jgi:hypothetical protein